MSQKINLQKKNTFFYFGAHQSDMRPQVAVYIT